MTDETQEKTPTPIDEAKAADPPAEAKLPAPKCPHCGTDPLFPIGRNFNMGPFTLLLIFCRECRNPVPANILKVNEPRITTPGAGGPRIYRPS